MAHPARVTYQRGSDRALIDVPGRSHAVLDGTLLMRTGGHLSVTINDGLNQYSSEQKVQFIRALPCVETQQVHG